MADQSPQSETHDCACLGCKTQVPNEHLCCRTHWDALPKDLQHRVLQGQRWGRGKYYWDAVKDVKRFFLSLRKSVAAPLNDEGDEPEAFPCPSCEGSGKALRCIDGHTTNGAPLHHIGPRTCDVCKGTGALTKAHLERIAAGKRLRLARMKRHPHLSAREEAARFGLDPKTYVGIEMGREEMTPEVAAYHAALLQEEGDAPHV